MEPTHLVAASHEEVLAKIEQKALRLSGLLREVDNNPGGLEPDHSGQLDDVLEMLGCRIAATRALLHTTQEAGSAA